MCPRPTLLVWESGTKLLFFPKTCFPFPLHLMDSLENGSQHHRETMQHSDGYADRKQGRPCLPSPCRRHGYDGNHSVRKMAWNLPLTSTEVINGIALEGKQVSPHSPARVVGDGSIVPDSLSVAQSIMHSVIPTLGREEMTMNGSNKDTPQQGTQAGRAVVLFHSSFAELLLLGLAQMLTGNGLRPGVGCPSFP